MAFKRKRYSGRSENVSTNKYFEDYMACVSKDKDRVKKSAPHGFISRCSIQKDFNFSKLDFENEAMRESALVCKSKGQIGLFFPLVIVRDIDNFNIFNVPEHWVAEQTIIRSFKKSELPIGFPTEFRHLGRFGKQCGRSGTATHFYSKAFLWDQFGIKVLQDIDNFIWARNIQLDVNTPACSLLRLTKPFTLVAPGYFGRTAKAIKSAMTSEDPQSALNAHFYSQVRSSPLRQILPVSPVTSISSSDLMKSLDSPAHQNTESFSLSPYAGGSISPPIGPQDMTMSTMLESLPEARSLSMEGSLSREGSLRGDRVLPWDGSLPRDWWLPREGGQPEAGSLPGAESLPGAGSLPEAGSLPGAGSHDQIISRVKKRVYIPPFNLE